MNRTVLAAAFIALGIPASAGARATAPLVDVHMHAYPADFLAGAGAPNPVTGKPSAAQTQDAIMRATLAAMDRSHIVTAVLSGPLGIVERWKSLAPGRFLASPHFPYLAIFRT